ncbi:MAG: hypothetical protein ACOC2M_04210 [bacterium]
MIRYYPDLDLQGVPISVFVGFKNVILQKLIRYDCFKNENSEAGDVLLKKQIMNSEFKKGNGFAGLQELSCK